MFPFTDSCNFVLWYRHGFLDMIFFYKATHNLVSLNGSVLPVKCVVRTTRYTSTVMKFVPKECKTATYRKTLFHQNLSDFEHLSQYD